MQTVESKKSIIDHREMIRYIINGVIATCVHFMILTVNMELIKIDSAGLANLIAAIFGITVSFIGSRYYVYRNHTGTFSNHAVKFVFLYAFIAFLHGLVLFVWSDIYGFDYRIGFLLATALQISLSYIGNKVWVFL